MAQGMERLDNGTKVFTGPGAAFGTDALLLARFAMPRRKETALDLCSGRGIVALAWHRLQPALFYRRICQPGCPPRHGPA